MKHLQLCSKRTSPKVFYVQEKVTPFKNYKLDGLQWYIVDRHAFAGKVVCDPASEPVTFTMPKVPLLTILSLAVNLGLRTFDLKM